MHTNSTTSFCQSYSYTLGQSYLTPCDLGDVGDFGDVKSAQPNV
jgi:hypothetical protein